MIALNAKFEKKKIFGRVFEVSMIDELSRIAGIQVMDMNSKADSDKWKSYFIHEGSGVVKPDIGCFDEDRFLLFWLECKRHRDASYTRKTRRFETSIDVHHLDSYQRIEKEIGHPVFILYEFMGYRRNDDPIGIKQPEGRFFIKASVASGLRKLSDLQEYGRLKGTKRDKYFLPLDRMALYEPAQDLLSKIGNQI